MVRPARFLLPVMLASAPAVAQVPEPQLAAATPLIEEDAMPLPPAVVAASFATPPRDGSGQYLTPNRDLTADEALWHLRVALNVAALGCRDRDELATVAAYNALLAGAREQLAGAQTAVAAVYRTRFGAAAQAKNDDAMTRLYNFFAQPTGHDGFCATAKSVLAEVATVEPGALGAYAAAALPRLEAPFLSFFASWDAYRGALAQWQTRHAAPAPAPAAPVLIAAASAPVAVVPTAAAAPAAPITITLTPEALRAIVAGQVPGVTIAAVASVATPAPATPPVVLASVR